MTLVHPESQRDHPTVGKSFYQRKREQLFAGGLKGKKRGLQRTQRLTNVCQRDTGDRTIKQASIVNLCLCTKLQSATMDYQSRASAFTRHAVPVPRKWDYATYILFLLRLGAWDFLFYLTVRNLSFSKNLRHDLKK